MISQVGWMLDSSGLLFRSGFGMVEVRGLVEMEKSSLRMDAVADYDRNFVRDWRTVFREYGEHQTGNRMWMAGSSSYVFFLEGVRFAVDLQIRRQEDFDSLLPELVKDVEKLEFILITHEHIDHLSLPLMKALKDTNIRWYIPYDSHREDIKATGIAPEKIVWIQPDDTWQMGDVCIRAFHTPHIRPKHLGYVHPDFTQCGYLIEVPDYRVLIPGDIRDYAYDGFPEFGPVDLCIAHVWGGRDSLDPEQYMPVLKTFAKRYASFDADRYFFCHLYEIGREVSSVWDYSHAGIAMNFLYGLRPEREVQIPRIGRSYALEGKGNKDAL